MPFDPEIFSCSYWYDNAIRLRYAAELLWEKMEEIYSNDDNRLDPIKFHQQQLSIFESYMMLMGFALENLIKAVSIKSSPKIGGITDFEQLRKEVWKAKDAHNIIEIAANCNFHLNEIEKELVARHTEFSVWAGRYHIPRKSETYDNAFAEQKLRRKVGDHKIIERLFQRGKESLNC